MKTGATPLVFLDPFHYWDQLSFEQNITVTMSAKKRKKKKEHVDISAVGNRAITI